MSTLHQELNGLVEEIHLFMRELEEVSKALLQSLTEGHGGLSETVINGLLFELEREWENACFYAFHYCTIKAMEDRETLCERETDKPPKEVLVSLLELMIIMAGKLKDYAENLRAGAANGSDADVEDAVKTLKDFFDKLDKCGSYYDMLAKLANRMEKTPLFTLHDPRSSDDDSNEDA
jgi:hypothetical protein